MSMVKIKMVNGIHSILPRTHIVRSSAPSSKEGHCIYLPREYCLYNGSTRVVPNSSKQGNEVVSPMVGFFFWWRWGGVGAVGCLRNQRGI